jgi:molybdenum cofactor sulfurtransferase
MCNTGATAALLGREEDVAKLAPGATRHDVEGLSVVRISLGLGSNFQDVWKVIRFAAGMGNKKLRQDLWELWRKSLYIAATSHH